MKSHSTAILLFTRNAFEEARAKQLTKSRRRDKRFFKLLINQTRKTVQSTGLPLFIPEDQSGRTFGERLTHAIQEIFDLGFEKVITIGNDTPHLTSEILIQASNELNTVDVVLGPSPDGGTYLLGLNRRSFDRDALSGLSWCEENTLGSLVHYANACGHSLHLGEPLQDIDNRINLAEILADTSGYLVDLIRKIKRLLIEAYWVYTYKRRLTFIFPPTLNGLRGPPIVDQRSV